MKTTGKVAVVIGSVAVVALGIVAAANMLPTPSPNDIRSNSMNPDNPAYRSSRGRK